MLDNTLAAVATLVAHGHHSQEGLAELISKIGRVLINDPSNTPVKQLALIAILEELIKAHPVDFQANNLLAVVEVLLVGPRILLAVSSNPELDA